MKPFLKWAGGKSQLIDRILPQLPEKIDTYYEPFIGGGAVFFALAVEGRFKRAVIADQNPMLITVYTAIRDDVNEVIDHLAVHADHATDPDYYYEIRAQDPGPLSEAARAARVIFLNKTCYNGLYRVNRSGKFNVPFGRYTNPRVLNEAVLLAASRALRNVSVEHSDFEKVASRAKKGDAVYFDPPYHPVSVTASFNAYDAHPFGEPEQRRLGELYRGLVDKGVCTVLSNSDCPLTREIYRGLDVRTVEASRAINSNASKRGHVTEILVVGARAELTSRRPARSIPPTPRLRAKAS